MTPNNAGEMTYIATTGPGGPEVLKFAQTPIPTPKENEVLIEVHSAGVNRPDLSQRQGSYPPPPGASPIMGLEVAGVIVKAGSQAHTQVGERVCALAPGGGYAQYCLVPDSHCLPLPGELSFEEAAGIPETFFTVWANVFQIAKLTRGERFLVHGGSSGIGTTAIQLARAFGAEVFATAGTEAKCAACRELGAQQVINYKTRSFDEEIARLTDKKGVNVILDMVGGSYTDRNLTCLAPRGRLVQIAFQQGAMANINLGKVMQKRLVITGSTLRPRTIDEKASIARELHEKVWPLFERKEIHVVIDRIFPFAQIQEAHTYLESGEHIGKVILKLK